MSGPSIILDKRVNAFRADLADATLSAQVTAPRYAVAVPMDCRASWAMLRAGPDNNATAVSALLFGEMFRVLDLANGWAWGQCCHDRYVGWVREDALSAAPQRPTHRIVSPTAAVFAGPDIKSPVRRTLPLNAMVAGSRIGDFVEVATAGGYVHHRHVGAVDGLAGDIVETALAFVGAPYVWGGRTREGVDCSGLTQAVLLAAGVACPRDSDQQRDTIGTSVAWADRRRGDIVCFPGHVGLLVDPDTLVHANAFWMTTRVEPLADVIDRLRAVCAEPVTAVRRPPPFV